MIHGIDFSHYEISFPVGNHVIRLSRQSPPKRWNKELVFVMAAPQALDDDRLFFVSVFSLSGMEPFNHRDMALFTNHGRLLLKNDFDEPKHFCS